MLRASRSLSGIAIRQGVGRVIARALPEEVPVAVVYNGTTQAVMMATPRDLEDFAVGFSLTERFISREADIESFELAVHELGLEARMWLCPERDAALKTRRRRMAGPVGCGLCGIDSLAEAVRPLPVIGAGTALTPDELGQAVDLLRELQPLHDKTHAVHAAGFLLPGEGIVLAREDVGRHNALDKLIGAMLRKGIDAARGAVVLTSRVSVEMVQKCAMAGAPVIVAVSAPTAHAVDLAKTSGLTIAAFARGGGFDLYSHATRIQSGVSDVAR